MSDDEIVRALAESVMGWTECESINGGKWYEDANGDYFGRKPYDWKPLTNDADSCAVLDKMAELRYVPFLSLYVDSTTAIRTPVGWICRIEPVYHTEAGITPAHRRRAVAIAALKAVGKWVE